MDSPLIKRMQLFTSFSDEDRELLNRIMSERQKVYGAREDIIREGQHLGTSTSSLPDWRAAIRIWRSAPGRSWVFLVPGDPCDSEIFILKEMDHTIGTISRA
jgi:hypothetical protein